METKETKLAVISQIELAALAYDLVYYSAIFAN
jgi:hypothetical protein